MFHQFGVWELLLILGIVLIVFGVGRLPQVGGALGKAIREFRKGQLGEEDKAESAEGQRKLKKDKAN